VPRASPVHLICLACYIVTDNSKTAVKPSGLCNGFQVPRVTIAPHMLGIVQEVVVSKQHMLGIVQDMVASRQHIGGSTD
jgi:hypothetical protein